MKIIALDTETTGFSPEKGDRIVEIACVELENYLPTGREYHAYINPERDMPQDAFDVHGLSAEFLSDYPVFAKIADDFLEFIGDLPLVIHNAKFDMKFLNAELALTGKPLPIENKIYDSMLIARKKYGGGQKLDDLCQRFGISLEGRERHGALTDTHLLAKVWQCMKEDSEAKPVKAPPKKEAEAGGLIVITEPATKLFTKEGIKALREKIEMKIAVFSENPVNIELKECQDSIRSFAYSIAKTKSQIEKIGKEHLEDLKKPIQEQEKKIKEMRDFIKSVIDMVTDYQANVRKPLTDYEREEAQRVHAIEKVINKMKALEANYGTLEGAKSALGELECIYNNSDFSEFADGAYEVFMCVKENLEERIAFLKREAELKIKEQEFEKQRIAHEIEVQANALAQKKVIEAGIERGITSATHDVTSRHVVADAIPETVIRPVEIDHKTINTRVMLALKKYTDIATAMAITEAILGGKIPHISIDYRVNL